MGQIDEAVRQEDQCQQQQDEEKAFFRCVELVQMAIRGTEFKAEDIQDLMYFLRVTEYFKEQK